MSQDLHAAIGAAREQFLATVEAIRPELHRYCARLTGSVIEGEDIVQETLARAFYALSMNPNTPPLRPWLFRIAHNAAIDFLKSHGKRLTDPHDDMTDVVGSEQAADPAVVRMAIARFLALPVIQRSAVILKDVLGHSLEETAETMGSTVMAVKAALVRGRTALREAAAASVAPSPTRSELDRYAALFNARDWDGVRTMLSEDCRLDLVARSQRRGKEVGMYFGRYAKENVVLVPGLLEGRPALAAHPDGAVTPTYFILLTIEGGRVEAIRDFRYVPYIAADAEFTAFAAAP